MPEKKSEPQLYHVKVRALRGSTEEFDLLAASLADARAKASKKGQVIRVAIAKRPLFQTPLTPAERMIMFTRLAAMLQSNLGASEAMALVRDNFTGAIARIAARLHSFIEAGDDIASAIARAGAPDFPDNMVSLIQAGARGGNTAAALRDAVSFEQELDRVRRSSGKGLMMGVGTLLLSGVFVVATNIYAEPMLEQSGIMQMGGGKVDVEWVFQLSTITAWLIGAIMAFIIGLIMLGTLGRAIAPLRADRLILRIPYYKDLVMAKNNFVTFYGLGLLIKSGVRITDALRLTAASAPKGALRHDLERAMAAAQEGRAWAPVMDTLHATDRAALVSSQDRTQVANTFDALAAQYRELYAARLAAIVPLLQLLAALFMSLAGGLMFGAFILPMLQATQSMLSGI